MVIDAFVRARLLGLQLLTLEARVVVGTKDAPRTRSSARRWSTRSLTGRPRARQRSPRTRMAPTRLPPRHRGSLVLSSWSNRARTHWNGAAAALR